jgi:hypothetical protein
MWPEANPQHNTWADGQAGVWIPADACPVQRCKPTPDERPTDRPPSSREPANPEQSRIGQ